MFGSRLKPAPQGHVRVRLKPHTTGTYSGPAKAGHYRWEQQGNLVVSAFRRTLRVELADLEGARPDLHAVDEDIDAVLARRKPTRIRQVEFGGRRAVVVDLLGRLV